MQSVQNATAWLITGMRHRDHIMLVICKLHWLPIRESVKFKVACPVHKATASHCSGRHLSTWQMTAASCPTALGALCSQLTFRLAWCREHSAVTVTELSQPLDLACGTVFWPALQSRHHQRTVQTTAKGHFFWKHEHGALWLLICSALEKHLLTYLLLQSDTYYYYYYFNPWYQ